jgi:hypothetical protein
MPHGVKPCCVFFSHGLESFHPFFTNSGEKGLENALGPRAFCRMVHPAFGRFPASPQIPQPAFASSFLDPNLKVPWTCDQACSVAWSFGVHAVGDRQSWAIGSPDLMRLDISNFT